MKIKGFKSSSFLRFKMERVKVCQMSNQLIAFMRKRRRKIQISHLQTASSRLKMRYKEYKITLIKRISKDMVKNKIKILNRQILFNTSKVKIKAIIKAENFKVHTAKKVRIKNMMKRRKSFKRSYLLKKIRMKIITN